MTLGTASVRSASVELGLKRTRRRIPARGAAIASDVPAAGEEDDKE